MRRTTPEYKREKKRLADVRYRLKHAEKLAAYRLANKEKLAAQNLAWRLANAEHVKSKADERYALHGEEIRTAERARGHAKRAVDPDGERAKVRARYAANPEPQRARCRAKRAENPELFAMQDKARRKAEPAKHSTWDKTKRRRRRARLAAAPIIDLTHEQWEEILNAFDYRCAYCPKNCWRCAHKKHALHQDHISPLGPTGAHTLHNVVPACKRCNSMKFTGPVLRPVQPLLLTVAPSMPLKRKLLE